MCTVREGWMRWEPGSKPWFRVLVDDAGLVFGRGQGGWRRPVGCEIKVLPGTVPFSGWDAREWWTPRLWRSPEWAWIYGAP
jgi:hypothetical protein